MLFRSSANLGIHGPMAFDLSSACSGFVYGLETARGLVLAHPDAKILLVSTEALTRRINWKDRGTSVVFGDGAGATVVSACSGFVYGLETARGLVLAHPDAKILLVSTEALTRRINWKDRGTSVVFGDGAGATVVSACAEGKAPAGGALIEEIGRAHV